MFGMEYIIIAVLVFIIVVLIGRWAVCWYFKINDGVGQLKEISAKLSESNVINAKLVVELKHLREENRRTGDWVPELPGIGCDDESWNA